MFWGPARAAREGGAVGCPFNLQEIPQRSLSDALILAKNGCRGLKHPKLCLEVGHPASPDRSWFIISHGNESLTRCTPVSAVLTGTLATVSSSSVRAGWPAGSRASLPQTCRLCGSVPHSAAPVLLRWRCAQGGCEMRVMGTDERCRVWGGPEVLCQVWGCTVEHVF